MRHTLTDPDQRLEVNATIRGLPDPLGYTPHHEGTPICNTGFERWIGWPVDGGFRLQFYDRRQVWWCEGGIVTTRGNSWGGDRDFFWKTHGGVPAMLSRHITRVFAERGLITAGESPRSGG